MKRQAWLECTWQVLQDRDGTACLVGCGGETLGGGSLPCWHLLGSRSHCCHLPNLAVLICLFMSDSLRPHGLWPTRLLGSWDSPGKNTGMGCYALLQGIFPTQRSNPGLLHCRGILYHLSHLSHTFKNISLGWNPSQKS